MYDLGQIHGQSRESGISDSLESAASLRWRPQNSRESEREVHGEPDIQLRPIN